MKIIEQFANPAKHGAVFDVSYDASRKTLKVPAGDFRMRGTDYMLAADEEIVFSKIDRPTDFIIYLVEHAGTVRVLSDAINDQDLPLDFAAENIKDLVRIATVKFVNDESEPDITVYHIVPPPAVEGRMIPSSEKAN